MTLKEVQQYLDVPRTCVYELVRQERFPAVKENGTWSIDWKELQRWINYEIQRKGLINNGTKTV